MWRQRNTEISKKKIKERNSNFKSKSNWNTQRSKDGSWERLIRHKKQQELQQEWMREKGKKSARSKDIKNGKEAGHLGGSVG